MFNISTKYSQNSDFRAILVNKSSNLTSLRSLIDPKSANVLRNKATKNKRGFTFISQINNSNFKNFYFFNVNEKIIDHEYQDLGGLIVSEALSLKKDKIEVLFDTLPQKIKNNIKIIQNILIGILSKNYFFDNYKQKDQSKKINSISLVCSNKNIIKQALKYAESINTGVTETRNLVTTPPNILNPSSFVNQVKKLKKKWIKN